MKKQEVETGCVALFLVAIFFTIVGALIRPDATWDKLEAARQAGAKAGLEDGRKAGELDSFQ